MRHYIIAFICLFLMTGCGARFQTPFGEADFRDGKLDPFKSKVERSNFRDAPDCEEEDFNGRAKIVIGKVTKNYDRYFIRWSYLKKMEVGKATARQYDIKRSASLSTWSSSEYTKTRCKEELPSVWLSQEEYNSKFNENMEDRIEVFHNGKNLIEPQTNFTTWWEHMGEHDGHSVYRLHNNWALQVFFKDVKDDTITLIFVKHLPWHEWAKNRNGWIRPIGTDDRKFIEQIVIKLK